MMAPWGTGAVSTANDYYGFDNNSTVGYIVYSAPYASPFPVPDKVQIARLLRAKESQLTARRLAPLPMKSLVISRDGVAGYLPRDALPMF